MITRFTWGGSDRDYRVSTVRIEWEEDRADYRRLDENMEVDVRAKLPVITLQGVFEAQNSNATNFGPTELWEEIEKQVRNSNTVTLTPDTTHAGPNTDPVAVDIVTRSGGAPVALESQKGTYQLAGGLQVQGDQYLDPSVTADKDLIDDLNSFHNAVDLS